MSLIGLSLSSQLFFDLRDLIEFKKVLTNKVKSRDLTAQPLTCLVSLSLYTTPYSYKQVAVLIGSLAPPVLNADIAIFTATPHNSNTIVPPDTFTAQ